MTIGAIIDQAQEFLHDSGAIWTRAELLNWANDGYRQLLAQSQAVVRPFQIDTPGRTAWSGSQEWEDRHGSGTFRTFGYNVDTASISVTYRWEAEFLGGLEPADSVDCITQLWELVYTDSVDQHMRLVLSKQHERAIKVYFDDKRMIGASVRELDTLTTEWWQQTGDPIFFFPSQGGRDGSYEVYEINSGYVQSYDLQEAQAGIPRRFTGDRTYENEGSVDIWNYAYSSTGDAGMVVGLGRRFTGASSGGVYDTTFSWEIDEIDDGTSSDTATVSSAATYPWEILYDSTLTAVELSLGLIRGAISPDRQYLAAPYASAEFSTLGTARDFKSSADAITIWEIIVLASQLDEDDGLSLIPSQMAKYLKFYVLSRAFSRKGRGFRPDIAQHFAALFQIGVALLAKIGNQGFIDRNYARESVVPTASYRPPLVQLPPEFERA
jgi:hypothetical protein